MINQLLESIDDLEIVTNECAIDVLVSTSMCYDKMMTIMENANDDDISIYPIFREETSVVQEGVGEELGKMNEGKSLLNKIIWFLPRLIAAIFKAIKNRLSKSSKIAKDVEIMAKSDKGIKDKLSSIWGKVATSPVGIVASTAVVSAAGFTIGKLADEKILKPTEFKHLEEYFESLDRGKEYREAKSLFDKYNSKDYTKNLLNERVKDASDIKNEELRKQYAYLSVLVEYNPVRKKMCDLLKEFVSDKNNKHGIDKRVFKKCYEELDEKYKRDEEKIEKLKGVLEKNNIKTAKLDRIDARDNKAAPSRNKSVDEAKNNGSFSDLQNKCLNTIKTGNLTRYPDGNIRSFIEKWKIEKEDIIKLGLCSLDDKTCQIYVDIDINVALINYKNEIDSFGDRLEKAFGSFDKNARGQNFEMEYVKFKNKLNEEIANFKDKILPEKVLKHLNDNPTKTTDIDTTFKTIDDTFMGNKGLKARAEFITKRVSYWTDDEVNEKGKMFITKGTQKKHASVRSSNNVDIIKIMKQYNDVNTTMINFLYDIISIVENGLMMTKTVCSSDNSISSKGNLPKISSDDISSIKSEKLGAEVDK